MKKKKKISVDFKSEIVFAIYPIGTEKQICIKQLKSSLSGKQRKCLRVKVHLEALTC